MYNNVLVLAPHTDDGELGAGGFISKLIKSGANVHYVAFSSAEESLADNYSSDTLRCEVLNATSILGIEADNVFVHDYKVRLFEYNRQEILEDLIVYRKKLNPDLVLLPSTNDMHQDHIVICQEGIRAFKNVCILGYELPWNLLQNNNNYFVNLSENDVQSKIKSLSCYKSQQSRPYFSKDYIYSQIKARGVQVSLEYAECFQVIRYFWR